jgi:hypothetical protein
MKISARLIACLGVASLLALVLAGCTSRRPVSEINHRPDCVSLFSYSSVIEQVMNVRPEWEMISRTAKAYQFQWVIEDEGGTHTLSATLTSDGCVCATAASSHFSMGSGHEKMVGSLEGAAIAPVSELNYASTWLEPKITFSCSIAYLFWRSYEVETAMRDGTTWKLSCSRHSGADGYNSLYTLTIIAPACADIIK